jgi:hypothetical protein
MNTETEDDDYPPDPEWYLEADNFAEECAAASELKAMNAADLRRAEDLCAMDCEDEDVNGWPARLHVSLNVDEP